MQKLFLGLFIVLTTVNVTKLTKDNPPLVVLELFTSQGCSSCPPADELLDKVKSKNQIIALSYHVDYWNYIGWKDPFSKARFSEKQKQYATKFNGNSIYTPQIVVNGREGFVGSNTVVMSSKIKSYSKDLPKNTIKISNLKRENDVILINYEIEGELDNKGLRTILRINERVTQIKRGENRNRTLKNSNIVVEEVYVNLKSKTGVARLDIPDIVNNTDVLSVVLLVQSKNLDITGGLQKML